MENEIKVGFCVAYDWQFLQHALPLVYEKADLICLALDRSRLTWAGNTFAFDDVAFRKFVEEIDAMQKVRVYEDTFYVSELTPMQNEVRQRNLMADFMKPGGWHIQLDCDEYFLNFNQFVTHLRELPERSYPFNVCCSLITLFKKVENGFLYIYPDSVKELEFIQIATRKPNYQYGRRNGDFNTYTNFRILHQSWARSDAEISQKITNWGHIHDFDASNFLQVWRNLNCSNYQSLANFHPIKPELWASLSMLNGNSIEEVFMNLEQVGLPSYSGIQLANLNSLFMSRLRSLWSRLFA